MTGDAAMSMCDCEKIILSLFLQLSEYDSTNHICKWALSTLNGLLESLDHVHGGREDVKMWLYGGNERFVSKECFAKGFLQKKTPRLAS
jgi:hypothetical protein